MARYLTAAILALVILPWHPPDAAAADGDGFAVAGESAACSTEFAVDNKKDGDLTLEAGAVVTGLRCADLDGDGRQDLVVLTRSDPPSPAGRGIILFMQESGGKYARLDLPAEWIRNAFQIDTGRYDRAPGAEILIVGGGAGAVAAVRDGKPVLLSSGLDIATPFHGSVHTEFVFLDCSFDLDGDGLDDPVVATSGNQVALLEGLQRQVALDEPVRRWISDFENSFFSVVAQAAKARVFPCTDTLPLIIMERGGRIIARRFDPEAGGFTRMESAAAGFGAYADSVKVGTLEYSGTMIGDFFGLDRAGLLLSQRSGKIGLLTELRTRHTFYDMVENPAEGALALTARQIIANSGISAMPAFSDLNADGHADLILRFVQASVLSKLLETVLDRVVITCQAYLFQPDKGTFSFQPDWSRDVPVPSDCFETVGIEGLAMLETDFSGDGRPDLVIYEGDSLRFFRGERRGGIFSSREVDFQSRPFHEAAGPFPGPLVIRDLDGDGIEEIITHGENLVRILTIR